MTQEDKDLLLKYLCMALPYEVIIEYNNDSCVETREMGLGSLHDFMFDNAEIKPYLRPMSSMTGDEFKELEKMQQNQSICSYHTISMDLEFINWYLAHHFDINHLIQRELAIEVTKDNNPYK